MYKRNSQFISFFLEMQRMPLINDDIDNMLEQSDEKFGVKMESEIKIDLPIGKEPTSLMINKISKKYHVDK